MSFYVSLSLSFSLYRASTSSNSLFLSFGRCCYFFSFINVANGNNVERCDVICCLVNKTLRTECAVSFNPLRHRSTFGQKAHTTYTQPNKQQQHPPPNRTNKKRKAKRTCFANAIVFIIYLKARVVCCSASGRCEFTCVCVSSFTLLFRSLSTF